MLRLLSPSIIRITTKLIVEEEAQVKPLVAETIVETTRDVWLGMLIEHDRLCLGGILGNFLAISSVLQEVVGIELWITILRIDSRKLYHIECTIGMTNLVNLCSTDDLSLVTIQVDYLIGIMRQVESGLPLKVLVLDIGRIDFQLDTLVSQLSHVHQIRAETCCH